MQELDIQVGDRVTYRYVNIEDRKTHQSFIIEEQSIRDLTHMTAIENIGKPSEIEILKIERPTYTAVEEKKELLTVEEKDFLKDILKYYDITHILCGDESVDFHKNDHIVACVDYPRGLRFKNVQDKRYELLELRIGGINVREIEFRGKDLLGRWQYGDLIQEKWKSKLNTKEKAYMIKSGNRATTVLEETIGEYTNRQDNKGNKIYTGDIVKSGEEIGVVVFDKEHLGYFVNFAEQEPLYDVYIEKIGNIVDNKELLEKENTDVK